MNFMIYIVTYLVSLLLFCGLLWHGWWSWSFLIVIFGIFPILEFILPASTENLEKREEQQREKAGWLYSGLLYSAIPIQYCLLYFYFKTIPHLGLWEYLGLTLGVGTACGAYGINVAHELGHRSSKLARLGSLSLLLTSLYMHFYIEHNKGHHSKVATLDDPATARENESLYAFWWRSVTLGFLSAWRLEKASLIRKKINIFSPKNLMIQLIFIEISFILLILFTFGIQEMLSFLLVAMIGFLLLETVNYIEHYGLLRQQTNTAHGFEAVKPMHSWNSNHMLGRAMLFDLTRHSDHHANPRRPYQILRHFDESPQLPTGYLGMILLAFFPSHFQQVMKKQLEKELKRINALSFTQDT
jgi:alkane 1-monooxygenase